MPNLRGFANLTHALANPNYGIYTAGNAVSLIGTWMQRLAVGWLTWKLTESGAWLGAMSFADLAPTVLIGPLAGAAADRLDRLTVTKISQALAMLQSILLFALVAVDAITIEMLLGLTLFLGIVTAFNQPARLALIPSLVRREDLSAAVAINSVVFNSARFIGPAVAGLLIKAGGIPLVFAGNALSFIAFLAALYTVRLAPAAPVASQRRSVWRDIGEGMTYAARHPGIGPLLLMLAVASICVRPFVELLPGFASEVFHRDAGGLAILTSSIGVGAVVGGLWLGQLQDGRSLVTIALGSSLVVTVLMAIFVATDWFWLAIVCMVLAGTGLVASGVATQTLLQLSVDQAMRGRVLSLYGLIFRGGPAIGAVIMGTASESVGLRWPLAAGALIAAGGWWLTWRRRHDIEAALQPPEATPILQPGSA